MIDIGRLKQEFMQNDGLPTILFKLERAKDIFELAKVIKENKHLVKGEYYLEICKILTSCVTNIGIKPINKLANTTLKFLKI